MKIDIEQLKLLTGHRGNNIRLLNDLNFRYCPPVDGEGPGHIVLKVEPGHVNGLNNTHGGVVMTLLDVAMAMNASHVDEQQRGVVTIEMKTNFLRPGGELGEVIEAIGCTRRNTRSIAFCEAELRNSRGEVLATASGTFKYINRPIVATDA
ncbi:hypothetical protein D3C76_618960 [compost metagenome]